MKIFRGASIGIRKVGRCYIFTQASRLARTILLPGASHRGGPLLDAILICMGPQAVYPILRGYIHYRNTRALKVCELTESNARMLPKDHRFTF